MPQQVTGEKRGSVKKKNFTKVKTLREREKEADDQSQEEEEETGNGGPVRYGSAQQRECTPPGVGTVGDGVRAIA